MPCHDVLTVRCSVLSTQALLIRLFLLLSVGAAVTVLHSGLHRAPTVEYHLSRTGPSIVVSVVYCRCPATSLSRAALWRPALTPKMIARMPSEKCSVNTSTRCPNFKPTTRPGSKWSLSSSGHCEASADRARTRTVRMRTARNKVWHMFAQKQDRRVPLTRACVLRILESPTFDCDVGRVGV
jgi:hypothetical protein